MAFLPRIAPHPPDPCRPLPPRPGSVAFPGVPRKPHARRRRRQRAGPTPRYAAGRGGGRGGADRGRATVRPVRRPRRGRHGRDAAGCRRPPRRPVRRAARRAGARRRLRRRGAGRGRGRGPHRLRRCLPARRWRACRCSCTRSRGRSSARPRRWSTATRRQSSPSSASPAPAARPPSPTASRPGWPPPAAPRACSAPSAPASPAVAAPSAFTTPEAPDLQALFAVMREAGVTDVAMEVSSHALALGRVAGTRFAVGAFTNLSQDHLDFHHDMEEYFEAKAALFDGRARHAVICVDDEWGATLAARTPDAVTVATRGPAAWSVTDVVTWPDGTQSGTVGHAGRVEAPAAAATARRVQRGQRAASRWPASTRPAWQRGRPWSGSRRSRCPAGCSASRWGSPTSPSSTTRTSPPPSPRCSTRCARRCPAGCWSCWAAAVTATAASAR